MILGGWLPRYCPKEVVLGLLAVWCVPHPRLWSTLQDRYPRTRTFSFRCGNPRTPKSLKNIKNIKNVVPGNKLFGFAEPAVLHSEIAQDKPVPYSVFSRVSGSPRTSSRGMILQVEFKTPHSMIFVFCLYILFPQIFVTVFLLLFSPLF